MASQEEEGNTMQVDTDPQKEPTASASGNENFVVIDMAGGDSEDSDKDGREVKTETKSEDYEAPKTPPPELNPKPASTNTRVRKKPKAPVVDVLCLRKRKWQLKVYPLHTDDLQLNYVSILCKLASESLLYIPSEARHGKAELYVATQKETATIIGKLLRMDFHHKLLSIEVVRKDTGGKEEGVDSKKECKAFLMFDKFLSKKIFDATHEKGFLVEKIVTLTKLPKEATKDFIEALFPFATEVEVFDSDNIEERKATVKCKTPVTSLLVYKSFKRLEINDVHVKLSVDDSVKNIRLPPVFFIPPPDKKDLPAFDSNNALNQSSLAPRRPLLTSLNKRAQMLKKKAMMTSRGKPLLGSRGGGGGLLRPPRGLMNEEEMMGDPRALGLRRPGWPGPMDMPVRNRASLGRDFPGGPGRQRFNDKRRRRDSAERGSSRRRSQDSQMNKEMLALQNQLNQAIKNQIAMLKTSQGGGPGGPVRGSPGMPGDRDGFGGAQRGLLGHGPRQFESGPGMGSGSSSRGGPMDHDASKGSLLGQVSNRYVGGPGLSGSPRKREQQQMEFGNSWSGERPNERPGRSDRERHNRDRGDRPDRISRGDRRSNKRTAEGERLDNRTRERVERSERSSAGPGTRLPQAYAGDSARAKVERERSSVNLSSTHKQDSGRSSRRQGDFNASNNSSRNSQRPEAYSNNGNATSGRFGVDYPAPPPDGKSSSYYRMFRE